MVKKNGLICFISAFLLMFICFVISNMVGHEGYSCIDGDLKDIYIPLIRNFYRNIFDGNSMYSWSIGMGLNTSLAYSMYILSPFNLIYVLGSGIDENILTIISISLRTGISAVAVRYYLSSIEIKSSWVKYLISILYAMSAFQLAYNCINILWLDAMWVLPLILCEIEKLFKNRKSYFLILLYAYIFITNFYMGYIIGVVSFLFFIVKTVILYCRGEKIRDFIRGYFLSTLSAIGMSAFVWFPTLLFLIDNRAEDSTTINGLAISLIDIYNQLFIGEVGTLYHSGPNIYCGVIVLVLLPIAIIKWNKYEGMLLEYWCVLVFLTIACVFKSLYMLMHAFDAPDGWDYRFSYAISLLICVIAARVLDDVELIKRRHIILLFVVNITVYAIEITMQNSRDTQIGFNDGKYFLINAFFLLLYSVIMFLYTNYEKEMWLCVLVVVSIVEIIMSGYSYHYRRPEVYPEITNELYINWKSSMQKLESALSGEDDFYRVNIQNEFNPNGGAYVGYNGVSYFMSAEMPELRDTLAKLGLWSTPRSVRGIGLNDATKMLLGLKYDVYMPNYDGLLQGDSDIYISQIERCLSLGYMVDNRIKENGLDGNNAFENINSLLSDMCGEKIVAFDKIDSDIVEVYENGLRFGEDTEGNFIEAVTDEQNSEIKYMVISLPSEQDVYVYVDNEQSKHMNGSMSLYGGAENAFYQNGLLSVSYIKPMIKTDEGNYELIIYSDSDITKQYYKNIFYYTLNPEEVERAYSILSCNQIAVTEYAEGYLCGNIDVKEGILFTSIPYDRGWKAMVNGEEHEVISLLNGAFCGLEFIEECKNCSIGFVYRAPGQMLGVTITLLSLIGTLGYFFVFEKMYRQKEVVYEG